MLAHGAHAFAYRIAKTPQDTHLLRFEFHSGQKGWQALSAARTHHLQPTNQEEHVWMVGDNMPLGKSLIETKGINLSGMTEQGNKFIKKLAVLARRSGKLQPR